MSHTLFLKAKGSNEIVLKAMGRAINKTITIVELIKVFYFGSTDICIVFLNKFFRFLIPSVW